MLLCCFRPLIFQQIEHATPIQQFSQKNTYPSKREASSMTNSLSYLKGVILFTLYMSAKSYDGNILTKTNQNGAFAAFLDKLSYTHLLNVRKLAEVRNKMNLTFLQLLRKNLKQIQWLQPPREVRRSGLLACLLVFQVLHSISHICVRLKPHLSFVQCLCECTPECYSSRNKEKVSGFNKTLRL